MELLDRKVPAITGMLATVNEDQPGQRRPRGSWPRLAYGYPPRAAHKVAGPRSGQFPCGDHSLT
jgi:hypothetical protein